MSKDIVLISDEKIIRSFLTFMGNQLVKLSSESLNCPIPTQIFTRRLGGQKNDGPSFFGCLLLLTTKREIYEKFMSDSGVWVKSLDPAMKRSMGSEMKVGE